MYLQLFTSGTAEAASDTVVQLTWSSSQGNRFAARGLGCRRMDTAAADEVIEPHERPWWGPLLLVAFVGLVVCTNVANVGFATVKAHPERLIMLSSRNRYLILAVGAGISPVAYAVIATIRLTVAAAVCHFIGRAYGDQAL